VAGPSHRRLEILIGMKHIRGSPLLTAAVAGGVSVACWVVLTTVLSHVRGLNFGATPIVWRAQGISMEPGIVPGDEELTFVQDFSALRPGTIVIFRPQGKWTTHSFVCHRIVRGFSGEWVTRGDNNAQEDPGYLTAGNYVATVRFVMHVPQR
jgi:signal peptidase I